MSLTELKPCPFCGGAPELDTMRAYRALGSAKLSGAVAIYCCDCAADIALCWDDYPTHHVDDLIGMVTEAWNRRQPQEGAGQGEAVEPVAWPELVGASKTKVRALPYARAELEGLAELLDQNIQRGHDIPTCFNGNTLSRLIAQCYRAFLTPPTSPPDHPAQAELDRLRDRVAALEAENAELKSSVIAFCAPWAVRYARDHGLPEGHLSPVHYDILERCGARMVDFTRAALNPQTGEAG